jgi:hypothetical protein
VEKLGSFWAYWKSRSPRRPGALRTRHDLEFREDEALLTAFVRMSARAVARVSVLLAFFALNRNAIFSCPLAETMTHSLGSLSPGSHCAHAASVLRREEEDSGGKGTGFPPTPEITPTQLRDLIPRGRVYEGCEYVVVVPGMSHENEKTRTLVRFLMGAPAYRLDYAHKCAFSPESRVVEPRCSLDAHVPALVYLTQRNFEALIARGHWGLTALLMETSMDHEYEAIAANFPGNVGRVLCSGGQEALIALLCRAQSPTITNAVVSEVVLYAISTPHAIPQLRATSMGFYVWTCKNVFLWIRTDVAQSLSALYAGQTEITPYPPFDANAYLFAMLSSLLRKPTCPANTLVPPPLLAPVTPLDYPHCASSRAPPVSPTHAQERPGDRGGTEYRPPHQVLRLQALIA